MHAFRSLFCLIAAVGLVVGCHSSHPGDSSSAATNEIPRTFEVHGVVRSIEPTKRSVTIKHDEITNYMSAMIMPFEVKNTNELGGLKPGDGVLFRLNVTEKDGWIDQIRVVSNAPAATAPAQSTPEVRFTPVTPVLKVGDPLPNYVFTNELGKTVHLAEFRGQALAFTFIFTRCPYPNFCPRMTDNLSRALKQLRLRTDAPTNFHLLSVSFDPQHDTAETLQKYGERFNYDPAKWSLVTGEFDQIEKLAGHFELFFAKNVGVEQQNHNLRTVVVDTQGNISALFPSNDWEVSDLVEAIIKAAQVK